MLCFRGGPYFCLFSSFRSSLSIVQGMDSSDESRLLQSIIVISSGFLTLELSKTVNPLLPREALDGTVVKFTIIGTAVAVYQRSVVRFSTPTACFSETLLAKKFRPSLNFFDLDTLIANFYL